MSNGVMFNVKKKNNNHIINLTMFMQKCIYE